MTTFDRGGANDDEITYPALVKALAEGRVHLIDVREQNEYDAGHVINSKLIPSGKLLERIGELEKYRERAIVVMCRSGQRSASACALLGKQGFTQVHNLQGGVMAWQKAGLPLEK